MFNNMGRKIRTVGKVFCWIGIVIAILAAIAGIIAGVAAVRYSGNVGYVVGIIIGSILGGCLLALLSWVGSFMLIGYGELIENTAIIAMNTQPEQRNAGSEINTSPAYMYQPGSQASQYTPE